ncbi:MAG TPA: hypothetical protein VMI06_00635 [Terriglobia bacterium]|nr:hypothetical protein [Terriglobia bacterium]
MLGEREFWIAGLVPRVIIARLARLGRLALSDRWFFITCRVLPRRRHLSDSEFATLAQVIAERRAEHRFLLMYPVVKRVLDGRPAIVYEESFARWAPCRGYVENVAHAIALATLSDSAAGRVYNVAEPEPFTEAEWAAKAGRVLGWPGPEGC